MKHLKLYGPMRSGTNYLAYLIEMNFMQVTVHHQTGGWKHGPLQDLGLLVNADGEGFSGYLLTIKHPFAWIDSMRRYNMAEWPSLLWLVSEWNKHAERLFSFSWRSDAVLVTREKLLEDRDGTLLHLADVFGLERVAKGEFITPENAMRRGGEHLKNDKAITGRRFDPSYYTERGYLQQFAAYEVAIVRENVDPYLCREIGYEI